MSLAVLVPRRRRGERNCNLAKLEQFLTCLAAGGAKGTVISQSSNDYVRVILTKIKTAGFNRQPLVSRLDFARHKTKWVGTTLTQELK
ncbi:MAG: hypothetical protein A3B13_01595 [Candidatus Liptonbacteria bacterium RIFCSPLOWO2_01_FULL_45_15]|uniref:Uncharacterized protein n=1 Tax=Candidatus Liptonbacteria bacterium RIFCSPLOWO2_01_FULL_45_15 TaxID=1798649 RepID=A0A1G2CFK9_9BACT|nr:MAG: hypothetical protein A3B13_01595 [Candidatus Liptonbacteria bacterium RIFCSPLOWO2_01_FULL_45_15]